jgi:Family of unknown function (DUF6152)
MFNHRPRMSGVRAVSCHLPAVWLLGVVPMLAGAHHSFAMFDMGKDVTLNGTVKSFQWQSPHTWLQVQVADEGGASVEWSLEMGAPGMLYRNGWRQQSAKPGDKITVVIHPLRDGRPGGSVVSAILADGTHVGQTGSGSSPAHPDSVRSP